MHLINFYLTEFSCLSLSPACSASGASHVQENLCHLATISAQLEKWVVADYVKRHEAAKRWESLEVISFPPNGTAQSTFLHFSGAHQINLNLCSLIRLKIN